MHGSGRRPRDGTSHDGRWQRSFVLAPGALSCVIRSVGALSIVAFVFAAAPVAWPHPGEQESIRRALLEWANGVATENPAQVGAVLAPEFSQRTFFGPGGDRETYLAAVAAGASILEAIDLRHARYAVDGRTARVADVLGTVMETTRVAVEARLAQSDAGWRIVRIEQLPELPPAARRSHPEQLRLETVELEVVEVDATAGRRGWAGARAEPVASRIHVEDARGRYWAPEGHVREVPTGWREDVGHDVVVDGRTWAYVPARTRLHLPAGDYTIDVMRGLEVTPATRRFRVEEGEETRLQIVLERWSDVAAEGWYSGDTHVHFVDPTAGLLELQGEDLNVLNILASKWGPLVTNVRHFTGAPSAVSRRDRIVSVGEETRHGWLGHAILLGIRRLVHPLTWGGPSEGVPGGFDHPPMATQADAAHAQGGLVTAAHFPWPNGELAVDVALGKLDAVDVFTWGDAFSERNAMPAPPALATWYRYLNCGFDLPATAGTDKMYNSQVSGSVRVYARVAEAVHREGGLDYRAWLDAIRAGRTFVTTGPLLTFEVDGRGLGETIDLERGDPVRVTARSRSRVPIERLEIVDGGRVVASIENPAGRREVVLETSVPVERSTWLAARAYSPEPLPYQGFELAGLPPVPVMAHTSPVYLRVDGAPRRSPQDARVLLGRVEEAIRWAQSDARFAEEGQRDAMVALFERAADVYRRRMASPSAGSTGGEAPRSARGSTSSPASRTGSPSD